MHQSYRYAIAYFCLFAFALLASGAALFYQKMGIGCVGVGAYYLGSGLAPGKSTAGILEAAVPHLGGMGLFIMVSAHFMLFGPGASKRRAAKRAALLFAAALAEIAAGFFAAAGMPGAACVKFAAFVLLTGLGAWLLFTVFLTALRGIAEGR